MSKKSPYASRPWLKNYPSGIKPNLDYPNIPLYGLLEIAAKDFPNNDATVMMGRIMKYSELKTAVDKMATAFADLGIKKGDTVAIYQPNVVQFIIGYHGALKAGAKVTCCSALLTPPELEFQLNDSGAQAIIVFDDRPRKGGQFDTIAAIREKTKLKTIILTALRDFLPGKQWVPPETPGYLQLLNLLSKYEPNPPKVNINPKEDIAVLQYTGGTTGIPKGAMLTHMNLVANAVQCAAWNAASTRGKEVLLINLPLFHIYGQTVCMNHGIYMACKLVLNPDPRDFPSLFSLIKQYKPSLFPGIPTLYMRMLTYQDMPKYADSMKAIRFMQSGAAPMPPETIKRFEDLTGGKIGEGYGLTECSPVTHSNPLIGLRKIGSVGMPFPDTDSKIMDMETDSKEVALGEVGELAIKGPQTMKGYWNKPNETAKQLKNELAGEKGPWVLTGDLAKMDEQGYFYIVDRKKDMIDVSGFKVYPREVDDVLFEYPSVAMAATVGVPDPSVPGNERVKAFVVLKPGVAETEELKEQIREYCKKKLAPYKVPKFIEFRKELPMTLVGKVLKRKIREDETK
ncbi:MAG: long-chain fatty acid--CoA ligase [Promethearchaeati archaeon SRVP18_Atabeyarchaeia-1]